MSFGSSLGGNGWPGRYRVSGRVVSVCRRHNRQRNIIPMRRNCPRREAQGAPTFSGVRDRLCRMNSWAFRDPDNRNRNPEPLENRFLGALKSNSFRPATTTAATSPPAGAAAVAKVNSSFFYCGVSIRNRSTERQEMSLPSCLTTSRTRSTTNRYRSADSHPKSPVASQPSAGAGCPQYFFMHIAPRSHIWPVSPAASGFKFSSRIRISTVGRTRPDAWARSCNARPAKAQIAPLVSVMP